MDRLNFAVFGKDANGAADFNQLCETGSSLSLATLEDTLKESRVRADNDSGLIAVHYSNAVVIMSNCAAFANAKHAVLQALEMGYYEILKCLVYFSIWEDKGQEHWFWAKIYGTPAFDKTVWDQQQFDWDEFEKKTMREDDVECYGEILDASFINELSEKKLREYIVRFDTVNIFNSLHPELTRGIAMDVDLVVEHGPARIIDLIVSTVHDLHPSTSHIAPHTVKSVKALQYLFFVDYNQIPSRCLKVENHQLKIQDKYVRWLIEHNCLSLLKDMCRCNTDLGFSQEVINQAFYVGSVDALKWLYETGTTVLPEEDLVCAAVEYGHLGIVQWLVTEFGSQVSWTSVVKSVKLDLFTFESIRYIRDHTDAIMPDSYIPMSLAAEGNLGGLQDLLKGGSVDTFPWKSVASIAAITGRLNILEWVHTLSAATPSSDSVETACKLGHHAVLV